MNRLPLTLCLTFVLTHAGCRRAVAPSAALMDEATVRTRGKEIVTEAAAALSKALMQALEEGGVAAALPFCSGQAIPLTTEAAKRSGVGLRRISSKNRNSSNAASPGEQKILDTFRASLARAEAPQAVVEQTKILASYYVPILVGNPTCLRCHGTPDQDIIPDDHRLIQQLYPEDKATGFKMGDLRGMWRVDFSKPSDAP
jgi:hypothetical protein